LSEVITDVVEITDTALQVLSDVNEGVSEGESVTVSITCAEVTVSTSNTTIDFGDGCTSPTKQEFTGKIIVSTKMQDDGSLNYEMTFENFTIDGDGIDGTIKIEGAQDSDDMSQTFSLTTENLTYISAEEGSTITFDSAHTMAFSPNTVEDETDDTFELTGSFSGMIDDSVDYSGEITSTLIIKAACFVNDSICPVEGIHTLIVEDSSTEVEVDYSVDAEGSSESQCDNYALVTVNGESEVVDLAVAISEAIENVDVTVGTDGS